MITWLKYMTGWWFGRWMLFSPRVGMIQFDELIFFRGVETIIFSMIITWTWQLDGLLSFAILCCIPSGKHTKNYWKSPFLMGKSTISMVIFNSYVKLPEGTGFWWFWKKSLPPIQMPLSDTFCMLHLLHLRLLLRKQGSLFCAQHVLHSFLYRFGIAIIRPMIIQKKIAEYVGSCVVSHIARF